MRSFFALLTLLQEFNFPKTPTVELECDISLLVTEP